MTALDPRPAVRWVYRRATWRDGEGNMVTRRLVQGVHDRGVECVYVDRVCSCGRLDVRMVPA